MRQRCKRDSMVVVVLLVACCYRGWSQTTAAPQSGSPPASAKTSKATASSPLAAPKLTPQQRQAVDILESVQGELGRFSPEMQAYLLQEMARAYKELDRPKRVALLKEALQAATAMPEGNYRDQQELSIVRALEQVDPAGLAGLQNAAEAKVRETVLQLLVKQDIDHGRLTAAARRLSQWDVTLAFPYSYAQQVISKLHAQQAGERQAVFSSAVGAYRRADVTLAPDNHMTDLVLATYDLLPSAMVLDAVDVILQRASKYVDFSVAIGGKKGEASFNSIYDFKLFELLPVLDKLDAAKANALRRDHANIAALTKKYPNGVSPTHEMCGGDAQDEAAELARNQQTRMADAIVESATRDPDGALANAQALSNTPRGDYGQTTPRGDALDQLATQAMQRKNFSAAKAALKALAAAIQDLPPLAQAHYWVRAAAIRAQMEDPQTTKQYLGKAMKAGGELYQKDAFGDPPNDAPKAIWPSVAVWKGALIVGERVDSGFALQQSASLPDPEIEAVANVAIAGMMLGQEPGMALLAIWHDGKPYLETMFDIPWLHTRKGETNQEKTQSTQ